MSSYLRKRQTHLKIPEQLLRNSFWINCIQLGIPLLLWDLPALRIQTCMNTARAISIS
jgi:hypothetical protein